MTADVRYRVMSSIRKHDTKPELVLRRALWSAGVRGWRCHARLLGSPDVAFIGKRVAVFVGHGVTSREHAFPPRQ